MPDEFAADYVGDWVSNSPWAIGWQTGRYYQPGLWPHSLGTLAITARSLWLVPTVVPNNVVISSLALEVTTGLAAGGANWFFGIYDRDKRGWPSDNVYLSSAVAVTAATTGAFGVSGLSVSVPPGLFWFAFGADTGTGTVRSLRACSVPLACLSQNGAANGVAQLADGLVFTWGADEAQILNNVGLPNRIEPVFHGLQASAVTGWTTNVPRIMIGV